MRVILSGVVGSTAYGLAGPDSDIDTLGTFVAPIDQILGLHGPAAATKTVVTSAPQPDSTMHEVGKFLLLCLKNNPTAMELLWLSSYLVCEPEGALIVSVRSAFAYTFGVRSAYVGYAVGQAESIRRRAAGDPSLSAAGPSRTAKNGRHCARLMLQAGQLLRTGELNVDMTAHRTELFAAGELAVHDPEGFAALFLQMRATLDEVDSVLRDAPDPTQVNEMLIRLRSPELQPV